MKRYVLLLLLFLIPIIPSVVSAQDLAQSDSDASSSSSLTYAPTYNSTGGDKRGLLGVGKMDPGYIYPLPPIFAKEGWKIWVPPPTYAKGITQEMIQGLASPAKGNLKAWATFNPNKDPIIPLSYYPVGNAIEMGNGIYYGWEKNGLTNTIMFIAGEIKRETQSNHILFLYQMRPKPTGQVRALGTAGIIGKAMGPAASADDIAGTMAFGSGIGKAWSYIEEDFIFWPIAFTSAGTPPLRSKETTSAEKNLGPHPQTVNLNISISGIDAKAEQQSATKPIIYAPSAIYFATDRYDIIGQEENLRQIADYLTDIWNQIKAEGKLVWLRGSCDIRGREGYNDTLGMNRGETASIAIGRLMSERGIHPREIADTFRYASSGEHQLQFKNHDMNRRVDVIIGKTITQELPPPPYVK